MAELLTRINSNLGIGNFEMNYPSGDVKFRNGLFYEHIEPSEKIVSDIIFRNVYSIDSACPLLSKFMVSDISIPDVYDGLFNSKELTDVNTETEKDKHLLQ